MRWDFARAALLTTLVCFPTSLALMALPLASSANADIVANADMLLLNNQMRFAIGSPTVPTDQRLAQAAQSHANYSSANGTGGHYETAGLPYYTGYAPRDRLIAQGWTTSFVSEVATGGSGLSGVRQRSEEHTSELQSHSDLVCRLLLEKKKKKKERQDTRHDERDHTAVE